MTTVRPLAGGGEGSSILWAPNHGRDAAVTTTRRHHHRPRHHPERPAPGRALRPPGDRAQVAGALGRAPPVRDGPPRPSRPPLLPADDVPLPVGRPAHRPLVRHDADRRDRPLQADARLQRLLPDGLRRVRAARRERGDQARHPPARMDDDEHREHARPAALDGRDRSTGTARSSPATPSTTAGTSGSSSSSSSAAWPTAPMRRSTGAPTTAPWPTSRSRAPTATAGAAARRSMKRELDAVVLPHHRLRRRAAGLPGIDWPEPIRDHADELDRPLRGRRGRVRRRPRDAPRRRRGAARLHDPAGHAVRRDLHGAGAGAPAGRRADARPTSAPRSTATSTQAAPQVGDRPPVEDREKTGVVIGAYAINPVNGERIPIWIADYVLISYGTGAIMAVPAHDERDFDFAQQFGLPIRQVIAPGGRGGSTTPLAEAYVAHTGDEVLVNTGGSTACRRPRVAGAIVALARASRARRSAAVTYRLRDWLISRQRYWGTPDPGRLLRGRPSCGIVPVPEDQLPVLLPENVDYRADGRQPARSRRGLPAHDAARGAAARRGVRPTRWTRSWTRRGTGAATCRPHKDGRPVRHGT